MNQGSVTYIWFSARLPNDSAFAAKASQTTKCSHSQNFYMMFIHFFNFFHRSHNTVLIRLTDGNIMQTDFETMCRFNFFVTTIWLSSKEKIGFKIVLCDSTWRLIRYPLPPFDPFENQKWAIFQLFAPMV